MANIITEIFIDVTFIIMAQINSFNLNIMTKKFFIIQTIIEGFIVNIVIAIISKLFVIVIIIIIVIIIFIFIIITFIVAINIKVISINFIIKLIIAINDNIIKYNFIINNFSLSFNFNSFKLN